MVSEIVGTVHRGLKVCVSFEGHPGIFVYASHESIRILRGQGYRTRMLPAVSTQEALFCDLLVDPGEHGCQSFDATDFLLRRYTPDTRSALILWQVSHIGDFAFRAPSKTAHLDVLAEVLGKSYGPNHMVFLYEAPLLAITKPVIKQVPIARLPEMKVDLATLYVPPLRSGC